MPTEVLPEQSVAVDRLSAHARAMRSPLLMAEHFSGGTYQRARHLAVIDFEFRSLLSSPDIDILIVKCPVRHGKSEYLARWAVAWYLLRHPHNRVMICTNTARLAGNHSRWVRDKVHELAPVMGLRGVDPNRSSVSEWALDGPGMGSCLAAGVGGSIVGFGANLLVIDDYLKDAKSAYSATVREAQWDWFVSTSSTRLEPNGKVVLLCTAWHPDDLIGRILERRNELGLRVRCVTLQALKEDDGRRDALGRAPGEALWPERWPAEVLERRKRASSVWWAALYQGRPASESGSEWSRDLFANIWVSEDDWPKEWPLLSASFLDPSKAKNDKKDDYQALVYVGYSGGVLYVDSWIDRVSVPRMVNAWINFNRERRPKLAGVESNAFQELLAGQYFSAATELGYAVDPPECVVNTVAKIVRIRRLGWWLSKGLLRFRKTASNELLVRMLKDFPNAEKDDGPDALEGAIRLMLRLLDPALRNAVEESTV